MNTADYLLGAASDDAAVLLEAAREYSYAELRASAAAWASRLRELDLPPGSPVALMAANGFFWVSAYLGGLSAGHVIVPMPVTLNAAELVARMSWVGCRALLLGRGQAKLSASLPPELAVFGEWDPPSVAESSGLSSAPMVGGEDALYEFTSGTTGQPRVVRLTHRNIQANTESILGYLDLVPADRALVVLPFSYVFGASLLHTHLRTGASMAIQPNFVYPESIVERMEREECSGFAGVPSTFALLLRNSSFARRRLPALRTIQQAGGRLPPALIEELVAAQPQAKVFIMYGQTEATARLSYLPPDRVLDKLGSIGRGIPGVSLQVVGADGRAVAPGEVGEIWAKGENISPGYFNDPVATAVKIVDGTLRTGDLATVDEDGFIYITDRKEDFIKSWGFRISSQEVEAVVMQLPDLLAAAAVGVPDDVAGERVEVVVVKRSGSAVSQSDVLGHCRRLLPSPSLPQRVHFRQRLPLNVNGKVSKSELREWCSARSAGREELPDD